MRITISILLFAALVAIALLAGELGGWADGVALAIVGAGVPAEDLPTMIRAALDRIGTEVREFAGTQNELRAELRALEQHVVGLAPGGMSGGRFVGGPSIGSLAMDGIDTNAQFQALRAWNKTTCRIPLDSSLRAALVNEDSASSDNTTIPGQAERRGFVGEAFPRVRLLDVLPHRPVSSNAVEFVRISSSGDAAEQLQEGDVKQEVDFEGTLETASIATIAQWTAAARQALDDHVQIEQIIDGNLRTRCSLKIEERLINGTLADGKISGLLEQGFVFVPSLVIQDETDADRIGEAGAAMQAAGYEPSVILMNPIDWIGVVLSKDSENRYLFSNPATPLRPGLFNTPIVTPSSLASGEALIIDTTYVTVLDRMALSVMLSNSHEDFFTRNLIAILCEARVGLEITDPLAVKIVQLPSAAS